jgi:hypothetical protein
MPEPQEYHYTYVKETVEDRARICRRKRAVRIGLAVLATGAILAPSPLAALPASNVVCQHTFFC